MKLFSNKLFLGGLIIGGLILTLGVFLILDAILTPYFYKRKLPEDTAGILITPKGNKAIYNSPKNNTATKTEKNATKPDTAGIYFEGTTIPKLTEQDLWVAMMTWHKGPQTVEALMASYHVAYLQSKRHRRIDKVIPPEQWLQSLFDKGYTILNYIEYAQYMDARTATDSLDNPKVRQLYSETFGIPESDIEKLKERYLAEHLFFLKRKHAFERTTDEPITGGYYIGDKVLPIYQSRKVVYVRRGEDKFSAQYLGTILNPEQRFNLIFRGIEPEDIEVIYIDEMGNQLSEKPEPVTREEVRKMMAEGETPPPEEWWDPNAPIPDAEDFEEFLPPERETELDFGKQRAREEFERAREEFERHAEEVGRQPEFEQFMQEVRQLEKFATMSDAEIAAELEKQLRQQLLPGLPTEENLEDALREKITPKPLTPERFNKAKQILQNYGPKEGLRRLAKADPELAEYFLRNPQKVPPKRSQPSNTDDSRKE
ncbi:MAG: hypothetical protein OXI67_15700 [Candidatus Poribacteria bacterium]|nr:hypothetical protein [Candidatus Poribacteria bacterium]